VGPIGGEADAKEVQVTYVNGGKARKLRTPAVVMACYNTFIPYLCPEIPDHQKEALSYGERVPLIYTNVLIRNWQAFQKLGVQRIAYLTGYFSSAEMDFPVSMAIITSPPHRMSRACCTFFARPAATGFQRRNNTAPAAETCLPRLSPPTNGTFGISWRRAWPRRRI